MLMLFWIPILIRELKRYPCVTFKGLMTRSSCSAVGIRTRCAYRYAFGSDDGSFESSLTIMRLFSQKQYYDACRDISRLYVRRAFLYHCRIMVDIHGVPEPYFYLDNIILRSTSCLSSTFLLWVLSSAIRLHFHPSACTHLLHTRFCLSFGSALHVIVPYLCSYPSVLYSFNFH